MNILEQSYQVPSASNMIHVKNGTYMVADQYALAPIILMHDSLGCVALWRDFPARLAQAKELRVVYTYDRLGFGFSDRAQPLVHSFVITEAEQTFKAVLDYFSIQNFVILGHSMGGDVCCDCCGVSRAFIGLISISAQYAVEALTLKGISVKQKLAFNKAGQMERLGEISPRKGAVGA